MLVKLLLIVGLLTANTCAADAQPFADLVAGDRNAPVQVI